MSAVTPQYIEIRQNRAGQDRAYVVGTRTRVQDVVIMHERFGHSADEIARDHYPHLTLAQVHAVLSYFFDNEAFVRGGIRQDEEFVERMEREYAAERGGAARGDHASLSS